MRHSPQEIFNTAARWLEATGSTPYEARVVADHLTNANLRGHDSHGVGMIAMYALYQKDGRLKSNTPARLVKDAGSILQFSGDRGYGQRVASEATMHQSTRPSKRNLHVHHCQHLSPWAHRHLWRTVR